jgi:hypothetical protein
MPTEIPKIQEVLLLSINMLTCGVALHGLGKGDTTHTILTVNNLNIWELAEHT